MSTTGRHDEAPEGAAVELLAAALGPRARGCFTTRGAGAPPVSAQDPYAGLNLALHVGDDAARVGRARRRLEEARRAPFCSTSAAAISRRRNSPSRWGAGAMKACARRAS